MDHQFTVDPEHAGTRIDVYLTSVIPEVPSRTFIKRLIDDGHVTVNGRPVRASHKISAGEVVDVKEPLDARKPKELKGENIPLDVLYEDEDLVVINKPSGITVHPATGDYTGTVANALAFRYEELSDVNGAVRPGIVHRLDRETSGVLVTVKNNLAHARLARQFEKHTVWKTYVARVEGVVQFDQGEINAPIGRHPKYHDNRRIALPGDTDAKEAVTLYQVLTRFKDSTLVELYPRTGRTHQIRLHMKHLGHPILGDDKYGRWGNFPRLALHALAIAFVHPSTKEYIEFTAPAPAEFFS